MNKYKTKSILGLVSVFVGLALALFAVVVSPSVLAAPIADRAQAAEVCRTRLTDGTVYSSLGICTYTLPGQSRCVVSSSGSFPVMGETCGTFLLDNMVGQEPDSIVTLATATGGGSGGGGSGGGGSGGSGGGGSGGGSSGSSTLPAACASSLLGLPHWYEYLELADKNGDPCAIVGPTDSDGNFNWGVAAPRVLVAVIAIMLRIAGIAAVIFTVYGGFRYIMSQGEPDATKQAKGTIVGASIGLVIAMFASIIVGFVGRILWQ